jgi:putative phage-type endonuclease
MDGPEQGSEAWHDLRCGWVGASRIADVMAKGKTGGPSASRANFMADLIVARLTGKNPETYQSEEMRWGVENESNAVALYEFRNDVETTKCSFIKHPAIHYAGASPDRLIGDYGVLEVKCFKTSNHIETLMTETIDRRYFLQIQWQLACTQRQWADFIAYDPRLPPSMQLFQKRIFRDEKIIAELTIGVKEFLAELEEKTAALLAKFEPQKETA